MKHVMDSVCEWSFGFVGVCGRSVSLYLIVGVGCHVVAVVGGVVVVVVDGRKEECHTL